MSRSIGVLTLFAAVLMTSPVRAHHNMSAYFDLQTKLILTGTLVKVDWRNPHIELLVDATVDGRKQNWSVEGPAPNFFRTRDVGKAEVVAGVGQTVTAEVSKARDGSAAGLLRVMNLPGGKVLSACPQNC